MHLGQQAAQQMFSVLVSEGTALLVVIGKAQEWLWHVGI